MKYQNEFNFILNLLKCAVTDTTPILPESNLNWDVIYTISNKHKITSTLYYGLIKLPNDTKKNIPCFEKFVTTYKVNLVLDANRTLETKRIRKQLEEHKIDYIFLKGSVIRYLYPDTSIRRMSDIDILFRNADFKTMDSLFFNLGYDIKYRSVKDTTYINKKNGVKIEIQQSLIDYGYTSWFKYLENIWDKCKISDKYKNEYIMSDEEFYIYHIIHMAKHFRNGGIGFTHILDIYMMKQKYKDLNYNYVEQELIKLGLNIFNKVINSLIEYWFNDNGNISLSPHQIEILTKQILNNGAYGMKKQQETNAIVKRGDSRLSLRKKIFPDINTMINYYGKLLYKHKFLLPLYWIKLNFERLFIHRKTSMQNYNNISTVTDKNISDTKEVMEICGL